MGCYLRDNFKQRLKYPLCSPNIQSIKYYMPRIRLLYIMNVLVKYQIKFGCLIVSLLTTKVIDRLCPTLYTQLHPDSVTLLHILQSSYGRYQATWVLQYHQEYWPYRTVIVIRPLFLRNAAIQTFKWKSSQIGHAQFQVAPPLLDNNSCKNEVETLMLVAR